MDYSQVETFSTIRLKEIIRDLGLKNRKSRNDMIEDILQERDDRYEIMEQLGKPGKEAITYVVKVDGKKYAMKTFKKRKSPKNIEQEVILQRRVADVKASPNVIDYDLERKYIVMSKLDRHLIDTSRPKVISLDHQKQLIKLYQKMDQVGVFHGDPNPLNYMIKGKKLYAIDFGMSKEITPALIKKLGSANPNEEIMTLAMVLKFKQINYPESSYSFLAEHIPLEQRKQFGI
jgi:RIO-like serine/threonine protein kinase